MATSLYDLSVACYLQELGGVAGFLERGFGHFTDNNVDPNDVVETRLFPDMLPFRFQIQAVAHHSLGTMEAMKKGVFAPPSNLAPLDYRGLQKLVADTREKLQALRPAEVNEFEGRDLTFEIRDRKVPFTTEGFVLSFSLPNLHFHATTAYDILRMKGVPVGKRDYMGQLRVKS